MLPDAVIAGAPKCGTSSLFRWLADHPRVSGSRPKETFFLMDRGHPLFRPGCNVHDHGVQGYARFFPADEAGARVRLEATTHYLYQETAPRVLAGLPRVPVALFLLRRPSERVYSSYQYSRNNQAALRSDVSFRDFVRLAEDPGAVGKTTPRLRHHLDIWRNDVQFSRYVQYLRRWAQLFPRERMHVLLFEDMRRDPRAFVQRVAGLLGIDPAFYDGYAFERSNESYRVRHPAVHAALLRVRGALPRGGLRERLRGAYFRVFTDRVRAEEGADHRAVLRELDLAFADDNRRLAAEFGVDTSAWD